MCWKEDFTVNLAVHIINNRYLNHHDSQFVDLVLSDLTNFLHEATAERVFLFPPVHNRWRFLIHKTVEDFPQLASFSIGEGDKRRTVVCLRDSLSRGPKGEEVLMMGHQDHSARGRGRGRDPAAASSSPHRPGSAAESSSSAGGALEEKKRRAARLAGRGRSRPKKPEQQFYVPRGRRELDQQPAQTVPASDAPSTAVHSDPLHSHLHSTQCDSSSRDSSASEHQWQRQEVHCADSFHSADSSRDSSGEGHQVPRTGPKVLEKGAGDGQQGKMKEKGSSASCRTVASKQSRPEIQRYVPRGRRSQEGSQREATAENICHDHVIGQSMDSSSVSATMESTPNMCGGSELSATAHRESQSSCVAANCEPVLSTLNESSNTESNRNTVSESIENTCTEPHPGSVETESSSTCAHTETELSPVCIQNEFPPASMIPESGPPPVPVCTKSGWSAVNAHTEARAPAAAVPCDTGQLALDVCTGEPAAVTVPSEAEQSSAAAHTQTEPAVHVNTETQLLGEYDERKVTSMNVPTETSSSAIGFHLGTANTSSFPMAVHAKTQCLLSDAFPVTESPRSKSPTSTVDTGSPSSALNVNMCDMSVNAKLDPGVNMNVRVEADSQVPAIDVSTKSESLTEKVADSAVTDVSSETEPSKVNMSKESDLIMSMSTESEEVSENMNTDQSVDKMCTESENSVVTVHSEGEGESCAKMNTDKMANSSVSIDSEEAASTTIGSICASANSQSESPASSSSASNTEVESSLNNNPDSSVIAKTVSADSSTPVKETTNDTADVELSRKGKKEQELWFHCDKEEEGSSAAPAFAAADKEVDPAVAVEGADDQGEDQEEDSWDKLFDDSGNCLDPAMKEELTSHVGEVEVSKPKKPINYLDYSPKEPEMDLDAYNHVLEISDFPAEFQTKDLLMIFKDYMSRGFDIKWVDDTHALAVFSSSIAASDALKMVHPLMKLRPLSQASKQSRSKARRSQEFLQPYKARPATSAVAARRLVTGALGLTPRVSKERRDEERKALKAARDKKREDRRQKDDIWDGKC